MDLNVSGFGRLLEEAGGVRMSPTRPIGIAIV